MRLPVLVLFAAVPLAVAQEPTPVVVRGNISVEAVEVVRQKPDTVKMYMKVEARNADTTAAADEASDEAKKMVEGLNKLKLNGMTVATLQQRTIRSEVVGRGAPGGAAQGVVDYRVIKPILVTVSDSDFDKFTATVEKVQLEAFKLGLMADFASDNYTYTPGGQQEKNSPFKAVYSRKEGWEALTAPALEKATKKARTKAEGLAAGAGVKLGEVMSVQEMAPPYSSPSYNPYGSTVAATTEPEDELVDGELVRKIKVRVVFATK